MRASQLQAEAKRISLLLFLSTGVRGRYCASQVLGLGQGVIRTLYRELRELGLIDVGRGGAKVTERGRAELKAMLKRRGILGAQLLNEVEAWGVRCRGVVASLEGDVASVVAARDAAVRREALMALVIKQSPRGFYLPMVESYDIEEGAPTVYRTLLQLPEGAAYLAVLGDAIYPCVLGLLEAASLAQS